MNEQHMVKMTLPCSMRYLNVGTELVTAMLSRLPQPPDERTVASVQLSVQEVCANIVEHAKADEFSQFELIVSLDESEDKLIVETFDTGSSFDPQTVVMPVFGTEQVGGYGLFLIKKAMDEVRYSTCSGQGWESIDNSEWQAITTDNHGQNCWRLVKYLA